MNRQRVSLFAAIALIATIVGVAVGLWRVSPNPSVAPAGWIFDLRFPNPSGEPIALEQVRGDLTVVNFWATWCPPCVEEMPELSRIHTEMSSKNIKVIGLAVDSPSNVREFTQKNTFSYPLLVTGGSGTELAKKLGNAIDALPYTVLIDQKGNVLKQKAGRIREEELRAWIAEVR
ncbi:MAG: Thiol-disulfide isomerase and thioredoxin [Pseudomonadota bacterium]|jgi:peroxiredoxin